MASYDSEKTLTAANASVSVFMSNGSAYFAQETQRFADADSK
jgi:hypothetical protein